MFTIQWKDEDKKYIQVVDKAWELFWKYGYNRVTVEEICEKAGISKSTFYKHFKNKIDLTKTILDKVYDQSLEKYNMIMEQDIPFIEKVKQSILFKLNQTEDLSGEFFRELYATGDKELNEYWMQKINTALKMLHDSYVEAQKKGQIRKDIKPEFIIYMLNKMMEMIKDENILKLYNSPQDLIMEHTNFFFYGVLPPGDR